MNTKPVNKHLLITRHYRRNFITRQTTNESTKQIEPPKKTKNIDHPQLLYYTTTENLT